MGMETGCKEGDRGTLPLASRLQHLIQELRKLRLVHIGEVPQSLFDFDKIINYRLIDQRDPGIQTFQQILLLNDVGTKAGVLFRHHRII